MPSNGPVDIRLDSWKEIANYLKRDVRTVRRWESENGLPVHRIPGAQKVFAYASELDTWLDGDSRRVPLDTEVRSGGAAWRKPRAWGALMAAALLLTLAGSWILSQHSRPLAAPPRFSFTRTDYPSPGAAWVVSADFNGAGHSDLLVANGHADTISVMLNQGDGKFGERLDIVVGREPEVLALGDFNNDGRLDVAVSRFAPSDTGIVVLLGDGAGDFRQASSFAIPNHTKGVAVGDFNRDGYLDLAVGMRDRVAIFLGKGDGTFRKGAEIPRPLSASDIHAGDLNHDGILDLVWANFGAGSGHNLSVAMGNGDGTFKPPVDYPADQAPVGICIADLNHDGVPDIVSANFVGSVTVLLGRGDGTFGPERTYPTAESNGTVAVADMDGDGNPDLIVLNLHAGAVLLLPGKGDGTFGAPAEFRVGLYPTAVAIADLNGDGKLDLAVSAAMGDSVSVLENASRRPGR